MSEQCSRTLKCAASICLSPISTLLVPNFRQGLFQTLRTPETTLLVLPPQVPYMYIHNQIYVFFLIFLTTFILSDLNKVGWNKDVVFFYFYFFWTKFGLFYLRNILTVFVFFLSILTVIVSLLKFYMWKLGLVSSPQYMTKFSFWKWQKMSFWKRQKMSFYF